MLPTRRPPPHPGEMLLKEFLEDRRLRVPQVWPPVHLKAFGELYDGGGGDRVTDTTSPT